MYLLNLSASLLPDISQFPSSFLPYQLPPRSTTPRSRREIDCVSVELCINLRGSYFAVDKHRVLKNRRYLGKSQDVVFDELVGSTTADQ